MLNFDCPVKNSVRSQLFGHWTRRRGSVATEVYLCLPARECLCIKEGMRLGIINKNTLILWAERNPKDRKVIESWLESQGIPNVGVASFSHLIKESIKFGIKIDLAFIDLCGEMTENVKNDIASLQPMLTGNAIVGITLQDYARNPNSLKFNRKIKEKTVGDLILSRHKRKMLELGKYNRSKCTVTSGILGHINGALPGYNIDQIMLYRSPKKMCNMLLTVLS